MMVIGSPYSGKDEQFFVHSGLTITETKLYLILIKNGPSTIGNLSKETGIQRPNLYKIIDSLSLKGLVEKELSSPIKYKATPPKEAVNMLIENKKNRLLELKKTGRTIAKDLEHKSETNRCNEPSLSENRFIVIRGESIIVNRFKTTLNASSKSLDLVTTKNTFSSAITSFSNNYYEAIKRGVKIHIITEDHQPLIGACRIIQKLSQNPCFIVRFLPPQACVDAIVSIFDEKETFTTFSIAANQTDPSTLWSNNHSFVSVMQSYFESKWIIGQHKPLNYILGGLARKKFSNFALDH
jgi:sugar-specific transcriptional regulator TrmB